MKIQRKKAKPPPVHDAAEVLEDKGVVVTLCGRWLDWDEYCVVPDETKITCSTCLRRRNEGCLDGLKR